MVIRISLFFDRKEHRLVWCRFCYCPVTDNANSVLIVAEPTITGLYDMEQVAKLGEPF